jgi:hypothetical protein
MQIIADHSVDKLGFQTGGGGGIALSKMIIDSSGNVGIGTSSPSLTLDVRSTSVNTIRLSRDGTAGSGGNASLLFEGREPTLGTGKTEAIYGGTGSLSFFTGGTSGNLSGGSERMRIDSSGKVGINNTSPDSTFHVGNSSDTSEYITLQSSGDKRLSFKGASVYRAEIGVYESNHNDLVLRAASSAGIRFVTNGENFSGNGANPIRIDTNGYLGIGTNSPSQRLDVDGSIEVSGGIYIGGTTSANYLDDYEEGTWTPTYVSGIGSFTSITYLSQSGYYTKIGRIVQVTFVISTNAITQGTANADIRISGLPFSISSSGVTSGAAVFGTAWGGENPSFVALENGNNYLNLNYRTTSSGNLIATDVNDLSIGSNANKILGSFTYQTA